MAMIIGVLGGSGRAGLRHAMNVQALGHTLLSYDPIWDEGPASEINRPRDEVIERSDILISATPTQFHYGDLCDAVTAKKPIMIEKPIASIGLADAVCEELERAVDHNVDVAVGFNLRFHRLIPNLQAIKKPFFVSLVCSQATDTPADGVLNHWASHEIDLAQYLLGPCRLFDAHVVGQCADLHLVNWTTNARALIHSDMISSKPFRQTAVIGPDGHAAIDFEVHRVCADDYKLMLAAFIRQVETSNSDLQLASGWDGYEVLRICEQASALNVQVDE